MTEIKVGSTLVLAGKSRLGKNRIRQFGKFWIVQQIKNEVTALKTRGPFLFVNPFGHEWPRWMSRENDINFEIVSVVNPSTKEEQETNE